MAVFEEAGLESLSLSLEELANIPDDVIDEMLMAGGDVLKKAHEEQLSKVLTSRSGKLHGSITVIKKRGGKSGPRRYVLVYPKGEHHIYQSREHSYTKYNWGRAGGVKTIPSAPAVATNADVGFVHEFGGHGNDALQWMRIANEKASGDVVNAMEDVYNRFLDSIDL